MIFPPISFHLIRKPYSTARSEKSYIGRAIIIRLLKKGLWIGMIRMGLQYFLGGRIFKSRLATQPDYTHLETVMDYYGKANPEDDEKGVIKYDGKRTFDKDTSVYHSGTTHEEKQPPHLKIGDLDICYSKCREEYQNPCVRFCPANVYEINVDEETGKPQMIINFSNCVHCKTCDVKDPYQNITWTPPEGGGGPKFTTL